MFDTHKTYGIRTTNLHSIVHPTCTSKAAMATSKLPWCVACTLKYEVYISGEQLLLLWEGQSTTPIRCNLIRTVKTNSFVTLTDSHWFVRTYQWISIIWHKAFFKWLLYLAYVQSRTCMYSTTQDLCVVYERDLFFCRRYTVSMCESPTFTVVYSVGKIPMHKWMFCNLNKCSEGIHIILF